MTCAGLLQSVLDDNGGLILWTAIFICDMSKTSWRMEKLYERRFGETFEGPVLPLGASSTPLGERRNFPNSTEIH